MKKIVFTLAAATCVFFAPLSLSAQEETGKPKTFKNTDNNQDFTELQIADLPQAINDAVTKDFAGASISKAFVNKNKEYKLILENKAMEEPQTVYANEKGEWIEPRNLNN